MPFRRTLAAFLFAPLLLTGCAALASAFNTAAPLVGPALDAYAATARAFAGPSAAPVDVQALADALRERDACTVKASSTLMPVATPDGARAIEALRAQLVADEKLLAALSAAQVDAGASK